MIVKILVIIMGYILMGIMTAACMKHSTKRDMIMAAAGWPIIWVISAIAFPLFWIFEWFDWLVNQEEMENLVQIRSRSTFLTPSDGNIRWFFVIFK